LRSLYIDPPKRQCVSFPLRATITRTDAARTVIGAMASVGEARAAVFALIGSFAESATYVRQRRVASGGSGSTMNLQVEVGTGELADARFDLMALWW
jgi:hypothetical protein